MASWRSNLRDYLSLIMSEKVATRLYDDLMSSEPVEHLISDIIRASGISPKDAPQEYLDLDDGPIYLYRTAGKVLIVGGYWTFCKAYRDDPFGSVNVRII